MCTKKRQDIAEYTESSFDTNEYPKNANRPLSILKNKKVIGMIIDELNWKIKTDFVASRAQM